MIWLTSDLHFGHKNVIDYCRRPYTNVEEMNNAIVTQWNSQVRPEDTVYFLGDFSLNPKYVQQYLPLLNGSVHLISGNHDKCFMKPGTTHPQKYLKMRDKYLEYGFKSVQERLVITLTKGNVEKVVHLCHFPFAPKPEDMVGNRDNRYLSSRPYDNGQILLAGHSHAYYRKNKRQIDVGFDGDLKLFSEHDIIDLILDPREYIPSPITQYYLDRKESLILKGHKEHGES